MELNPNYFLKVWITDLVNKICAKFKIGVIELEVKFIFQAKVG